MLLLLFILNFSGVQGQESVQPTPEAGTVEIIGDVIKFTMPAATLGTSLLIGDKKGAWQFSKGIVLTAAVTYGLKYAIDKERPDMSNNDAFPSGHTSVVFHSAGYVHRRYGFKYSIPSYLLAGFTAASRIDADKHDLIDVTVGAAIGLCSNLLFTTEYQQEHMQLSFNSGDGSYLLGFTYKF
ncbi:phosphatase PAP2 family protein [Robertkochia marina]|uniref:Phosphatase PAP2 family protein n=2 Tax=Robertkochia marina TaxID=1227945 RepID=A0A4S3LYW7_9FLAO|nr:phosphatase PAP2 family protein [Robertkochia marina]THD66626.1 phosphatase PAP2 family protein [Robertkochia marina]TRZ45536.1 PAP2 family protein [Robertkochia marina]